MSSTTDRHRTRGQVIVIFALSFSTIIVIAALAFDAGMMLLQRRDQQNAADAAALAGARYVRDDAAGARDAAREIATANGFTHGIDNAVVNVHVPPVSGRFRSLPGFVEVVITSNRPSIFGGVIGVMGWDVSARAVAANQKGLDLPFAMLTLHPDACKALQVSGSGVVTSAGTIQVNSGCSDALHVSGTGTLEVTAEGATCNSAGGIVETKGPGSELDCVQVTDSYVIEDPLRRMQPPPVPNFPPAVVAVSGATSVDVGRLDGCPGSRSKAATVENPRTCVLNTAGAVWRLFPGYYPGGIDIRKGLVYLEPGIYYIGGGGFKVAGGGARSVDAGATAYGGGVLIYNSDSYEWHDECVAGTYTGPGCFAGITLNGGTAEVSLRPLDDGTAWAGLVIFQDRNLTTGNKDVQINGGGSTMEVAGTMYVPSGNVEVNGGTGTLILDQVIASTFKINGNEGNINVMYRSGLSARVSGVGLVE